MAKRRARTKPHRQRRKPRARAARTLPSRRVIEAALAGIAHDIRTPLTGILALAELLASSNLGERERAWANAIKSGANHLAAQTTLIVDAAKADVTGLTLRHEPFSPRALAEAVGQGLTARAGSKNIKAEIVIARDLPATVAGDSLRLRAALENLADNAVKFTQNGTVTFAVAAEPVSPGRMELIFTFLDSGIGMTANQLKRLFKPFAQASARIARRYGGAGLGLVFVKRIAEAMGGSLTVTSAAGRGITFRLSVPAKRVRQSPPAERRDTRAAAGRALAILCAEDNPYGRVVMNTILTELGHRVDFVETGEAAIKAAARGSYDAVVMDVALTGLDGLTATRRIRALPGKACKVPVIGISGRSNAGEEQAARAAGMNFYFVKPVSPRTLALALASHVS